MDKNSRYSIEELCNAAGFSRQAHYNYINRSNQEESIYNCVYNVITQIRKVHSTMGLRKIWYNIQPDWIGRDKFITIGVDIGLEVPRPKNYQRTTFSKRGNLYPNLTSDLKIRDINRVWVSDITYFYVNGKFYYLTFILDVYSRRIIGWIAAKTLAAQPCCIALKKAFKTRQGYDLTKLIHHSDKGVQYTSDSYLEILKQNNVRVSLCSSVYENTHIERLNGIIKNEYLYRENIKNFEQLSEKLNYVVNLYNKERPHFSLGYSTPIEFEESIINIPLNDRKELTMWSDKSVKRLCFQELLFN